MKLHPIVRVYDHASVSNFCIIFVLLVACTVKIELRVTIIAVLKVYGLPIIRIDCR